MLILPMILAMVAVIEPCEPGAAPQGLQLNVSVRAGDVGGAAPSALPGGRADMDVITDGRSVRVTLHGQMGALSDGLVSLTPAEGTVWYKIDPRSRTYEVRKVTRPGQARASPPTSNQPRPSRPSRDIAAGSTLVCRRRAPLMEPARHNDRRQTLTPLNSKYGVPRRSRCRQGSPRSRTLRLPTWEKRRQGSSPGSARWR